MADMTRAQRRRETALASALSMNPQGPLEVILAQAKKIEEYLEQGKTS